MLQPTCAVTPSEYRRSVGALHLSVMLFGLSSVLGQWVDAPAVTVAGGRVVCSALVLLLLSLAGKLPLRLNSGRDYRIAMLTGVILAVHWTSFFQSVQSASVAIGTITFSTFPLFLTFLEPLLFQEPLRPRSLLRAGALLAGVIITVPDFSLANEVTVGILWGMISSLAYALMALANRYLSGRYPARIICLYEQGTAAIVLLPALVLVPVQWTTRNLLAIAAIGSVCTAFAHSLYVAAQKKVRAQTAGIISGMETVYGIAYALVFLGEVPSPRECIGGAVILITALFASLQPSREPK